MVYGILLNLSNVIINRIPSKYRMHTFFLIDFHFLIKNNFIIGNLQIYISVFIIIILYSYKYKVEVYFRR